MSAGDFTIPDTTPSRAAANKAYFTDPWHFPPPSDSTAEGTMRAAIASAIEQADLSAVLQVKWLGFVDSGRTASLQEFCGEFAEAVKEALLR